MRNGGEEILETGKSKKMLIDQYPASTTTISGSLRKECNTHSVARLPLTIEKTIYTV